MMGILDDAIRQHLELKRRQGAADAELARLEDEAFGPPSRPGEPDFPGSAPEAHGETTAAADPQPAREAEAAQTEVVAEADQAEQAAAAFEQAPDQPAVVGEPPAGSDLDELDLELDEEFVELGGVEAAEPPPAAASLDTVEHPAPVESLDTVEHSVEEAPLEEDSAQRDAIDGGEEELEGEDVLEETPEFLRDQPEDDELWFEQGEPKDFDF